MKIELNGLEITQEAARERLDSKDPIMSLLDQSEASDVVQTLVLDKNMKLRENSVLIAVYDEVTMTKLDKIIFKLAKYLLNMLANKNKK